MASTYSQMRVALDEITTRIQTNTQRVVQVKQAVDQIDADVAGIATQYSGIISDINAYLTANPNSDAAKLLKSEKDALVAEFQALKTQTAALKTAVNG